MSEAKRYRKQNTNVFPGLPGDSDYFVFYFLKARQYSDPVYIASSSMSLIEFEDRLQLSEVIFQRTKVASVHVYCLSPSFLNVTMLFIHSQLHFLLQHLERLRRTEVWRREGAGKGDRARNTIRNGSAMQSTGRDD